MINRIEGRLLLKETPIRLDFKDAPLEEVVKSLAKQAGFNVVLTQAAPDVGARRITLQEPKPIPFGKRSTAFARPAGFPRCTRTWVFAARECRSQG